MSFASGTGSFRSTGTPTVRTPEPSAIRPSSVERGVGMRIIALEEHFTTQALRNANADDLLLQEVRKQADEGEGGFAGVTRQLLDLLLDLGEQRIPLMDAAGIGVQVLSHTTPGPERLEPTLAVR